MRQQKQTPAPIYHEPVVIEDLESGERVEHGPKEPQEPEGPPPLSSMTESYKEALTAAANKKRSRGVKRLLSLHAAICQKKQRGGMGRERESYPQTIPPGSTISG